MTVAFTLAELAKVVSVQLLLTRETIGAGVATKKIRGNNSMSAITRPIERAYPAANAGAAYRTIWRWHFLCRPVLPALHRRSVAFGLGLPVQATDRRLSRS